MKEAAMTSQRPWKDSRIVLGVTGSIAAYKSIQVARDLTQLGAKVDVVLTKSAQYFAPALSFEGVTGRPALTDLFSAEGAALHVRLGQDTDALCVAPATADFLSRAAQGRADDLICTTLLATQAPVVICPAMNSQMFAHAQVQANLDHLRSKLGYTIAGPTEGALAAGESDGPGRMIEPWQIVEHLGKALTGASPLTGKQVLVTAGPTREPVDPVRYIANRSSGAQGAAIAKAARDAGARVSFITGPASVPPPEGVDVTRVETAQEMREAVLAALPADAAIFAAAVADWRVLSPSDRKMKKSGGDLPVLEFTENPDILAEVSRHAQRPQLVIGFAAETHDVAAQARAKRERKGCDWILANDVSDGSGIMGGTENAVTLITADGSEDWPRAGKDEVASRLIGRVAKALAGGTSE